MASTMFSLVIMFAFIIIGIISISVILAFMKSNRLVVRRDVDGKSLIDGYYWMIPRKAKADGTIWWVSAFWQKKIKIQEPPNEVMDINSRGKKWVEVYRLSEDEYCFIKDDGLNPEAIVLSGKQDGNTKRIKDIFQPFSLVQRETIIQQYKKANAEKDKDRLSSLINNIPIIVLGMVVIVGMIYAGEISNAFMSVGNQADSLLTKAAKTFQSARASVADITPQQSSGVAVAGEEAPTG